MKLFVILGITIILMLSVACSKSSDENKPDTPLKLVNGRFKLAFADSTGNTNSFFARSQYYQDSVVISDTTGNVIPSTIEHTLNGADVLSGDKLNCFSYPEDSIAAHQYVKKYYLLTMRSKDPDFYPHKKYTISIEYMLGPKEQNYYLQYATVKIDNYTAIRPSYTSLVFEIPIH